MKPNLIGVAGYARAGKDTVGAYLVERHGYERRAFADKLRELAWEVSPHYGDEVAAVGYEAAKERILDLRPFLVRLGAGARKVLGGDVWLDAAMPPAGDPFFPRWESYGLAPAVFTDVRYANEAQRIVELGGQVWYVTRDGVGPANEEERGSIHDLLNECGVKLLANVGTIEQLHARVEKLLTA